MQLLFPGGSDLLRHVLGDAGRNDDCTIVRRDGQAAERSSRRSRGRQVFWPGWNNARRSRLAA